MGPYYDHDGITLYHGDCLDVMASLEATSFDAVIADVPFGSTDNPWDQIIPFAPMWSELKRLTRRRAAIVLFAREPFSSTLVVSNPNAYKHKWIWDKGLSGSFHLAKYQPLQVDEDIFVFGFGPVNYYPQMVNGKLRYKGGHNGHPSMGGLRPIEKHLSDEYYPSNILRFTPVRKGSLHPTQKPLALMEYLVKTYTHEGDTVLDFTSGSGTTLRAAKNLNRYAVGIELHEPYCAATVKRLAPTFEDGAITARETDYGPLFEGLT